MIWRKIAAISAWISVSVFSGAVGAEPAGAAFSWSLEADLEDLDFLTGWKI